VTTSEFFIAIDFSGVESEDMVRELISRILTAAGCDAARSSQITDGLRTAVGHSTPVFRVSFLARNRHLEVSASSAGAELWRTNEPLA
jgi:hypothetical protein